jgi:hypothetical protein
MLPRNTPDVVTAILALSALLVESAPFFLFSCFKMGCEYVQLINLAILGSCGGFLMTARFFGFSRKCLEQFNKY